MDDEADMRKIASAILGRSQRRSGNCGKRLTGDRPYRSGEPDVLVADIGMPGEDGYDLISKVRARFSDKRGQIPAIALTAFARPQDRLKILSAGYQMHVPNRSNRSSLRP
jgi:CheY-like chemotaxis protein